MWFLNRHTICLWIAYNWDSFPQVMSQSSLQFPGKCISESNPIRRPRLPVRTGASRLPPRRFSSMGLCPVGGYLIMMGPFHSFTAALSECVCLRRNLEMCSSNKQEGKDRRRERSQDDQCSMR